jgi:hypothetical protein
MKKQIPFAYFNRYDCCLFMQRYSSVEKYESNSITFELMQYWDARNTKYISLLNASSEYDRLWDRSLDLIENSLRWADSNS